MGNTGVNRSVETNGFMYARRQDSDTYGYGPVARYCECVDEVLGFRKGQRKF
jgi:hypothetical protein